MLSQILKEQRRALSVVALGVGLVSGGLWYVVRRWRSNLPTEWEEVGTVSRLLIYPLKSAKAISVQFADATKDGLTLGKLRDRSFMVVNEEYRMVTGREANLLVTLETGFQDSTLTIRNPNGGDSIQVDIEQVDKNNNWITMKIRGDDVQGVDCGDPVAEWLTKTLSLEKKLRLLYVGKRKYARASRKFTFFTFPTFKEGDTTLFNDSSSYNIATESSLEDLNERLEKPVNFEYFRPPIVVTGTKSFEEDDWLYVKIGNNVVFRLVKPCERCALTQIDPETGKKATTHFEELRKYRTVVYPEALAKQWSTRPIFGINCANDVTGHVNVGDKVYVSRFDPYWRPNGKNCPSNN